MDASMSGQAIYENFTGGSLSGLVGSAAETERLGIRYHRRIADLRALAEGMKSAWQGQAADSARQAGEPPIVGTAMALPHIFSATRSMAQQAELFEAAKNSVVPIPPMPTEPGVWNNVQYQMSEQQRYENQVNGVNEANAHNVAVMRAYEAGTRQNQDMLIRIPTELNPIKPPGGEPPQPPGGPGPAPLPWRVPTPPRGGGGPAGGAGSGGSGGQGNTQGPVPQPLAPGHILPGLTHADSAQPVPTRVTVDVTSPKPTTPGLPGAGIPPVSVGPINGGVNSGADPRRAGGPGGGRGFGPGTPGGPGEDGARSGSRGGVGSRMPEGTGGRGLAGTPGRGNAGGLPQMGAGARGQGGEDTERERPSFLVDPDPDETFGTDEVTAPPVIGG